MEGITSLAHVALKVKDLDRSLDFYVNKLGFKEMMRLDKPDGSPGVWLVYLRITDDQYLELFPDGEGDRAPGRDATAINIRNRYAALHGARLRPGDSVELPDAPYLHLFVPRGSVTLEDAGNLAEGDAVRFTAAGGRRLTATADAEILVWEMHAGLAG